VCPRIDDLRTRSQCLSIDLAHAIPQDESQPHQGGQTVGNRLFVGVLGNRNSGKSSTWNELFGTTVRRGKYSRPLELRNGECVEVYLVSGSFEERKEYAGDILDDQTAKIVLCSDAVH
jgi:hypothetical protein